MLKINVSNSNLIPIIKVTLIDQNEQYKCVCVIVKVQLVTHSIIPNLNSGLVPIDPVGLVYVKVPSMEAGLPGVPGSVLVNARDTGTTSVRYAPLLEQEPAQILHLHTMETIALEIVEIFILKDLGTLYL